MITTKDAGCDPHLPHSLRKINCCDVFFTQQKYPYRCMEFLLSIIGSKNQLVSPRTGVNEHQSTTTFNIETYCTGDKSRFNYWIYPHYYKNSQNILVLNIVRRVILWLYFAHVYYKPYLHQKLGGRRPLGGGTRPSFSVFSRKLLRRTTGPPQPSGVTCRTRHTFN